MDVNTITITDWHQLVDLQPECGMSIYRGQRDISWDMETSLRRTIIDNNKLYTLDDEQFAHAERMSLRTFKARAHFYLNHLPHPDDSLGWVAVMQHHGTPTRLLDFSYSLYVAMYFALIDATTDSCVWAIDDNWLRSRGSMIASSLGLDPSNDLRFGELDAIYKAGNYVLSTNNFDGDGEAYITPALLMVEMNQQIPRLAIQQGIFLMPTVLKESFTTNMTVMHDDDPPDSPVITKIVFPLGFRCQALMHLRAMNITAETLFPGIDGFAASLVQQDML